MFNKTKRILALLLALVMVFSLAACGKSEGEESEEVEIVYEYEYEEGEDSGETSKGSTTSGGTTSGGTTSGGTTSGGSSGTSVNPADYKGTTVRYATWLDPDLNEDGPVVKAFEKKYGIKVQIDIVSQDDYPNLIAGMISSGDSPDVYFSNNTFPSDMACLQPLSASKIDMSDEIWNQTTFKLTTYDGEPYLCDTMGNIWAESDLLYYNKSLLDQANCNTPEEYDAAGKWSWDAIEEIATACSQLPGITGFSIMTPDSLAGAVGCGIYVNENGKFKNGMNDQLKACYRRMAQWTKDGIMTVGKWRTGFIEGKVALTVTHSYGLKKTGHWKSMDWNNIGFYTIPPMEAGGHTYQTGCFRGWGIIRGAKNPVGAGIFLRYYLDPNNYDNDAAFINSDAETFFYKQTYIDGSNYFPYWTFGGTQSASGLKVSEIFQCPYTQDPTQIDSFINSQMNAVDNAVKNMNDFTEKEKGYN